MQKDIELKKSSEKSTTGDDNTDSDDDLEIIPKVTKETNTFLRVLAHMPRPLRLQNWSLYRTRLSAILDKLSERCRSPESTVLEIEDALDLTLSMAHALWKWELKQVWAAVPRDDKFI